MREEFKWRSGGVLKVVGPICNESENIYENEYYLRSFNKQKTLYYTYINQYKNLNTVKI